MRLIQFGEHDSELFRDMYLAFLSSSRTVMSLDELPTVVHLVEKLQAISAPELPTNGGPPQRRLIGYEGTLTLEEAEYTWLLSAVLPPAARWNNMGVMNLGRLYTLLREAPRE